MLKTVNLKKYFGGVKAVNDCSFEAKPCTITALMGPNGAGKSTVFNLVSGLLKAEAGKMIFDGRQINKLSPEDISNLGISRLFQQTKLFKNLTVKENLLLAFDNEDTKFWKNLISPQKESKEKEKKIEEMLEKIKLGKFKNTLSRELSYGQKRLIELIRAILNPHKFLMLDEPVAGVNPKLRIEITELLRELKKKGETILLIEHDMNFTLKVSDWVIVMEKGRVIAQGKPEEIKNDPRVLEAYLGE